MQNIPVNTGTKEKKKSSNWFLIIAILVFVVVMAMIGLAYIGGGLRNYENKDYGITMSYPADWNLEENVEGTLAIFSSAKENSMDLFQENVNLVVQDLSANPMTLEEYTDTAIKQLVGVFNNIKIVDRGSANLGRLPGYKIVYEATGDFSLKIMHVWAVDGTRVFTFTYSSELSKFNTYFLKASAMLASLKFK